MIELVELLARLPPELVKLLGPILERHDARKTRQNAQVVLRSGTRGPIVQCVQERLVELGDTLDTDGIYGRATQAAIIRRQSEAGIRADGLCGPDTFAVLWPPSPSQD